MKRENLTQLLLALFAMPMMASAQAGPQTVSFDGKLVNPDGTSMVSASIPIKIQILNPSKTCLLYEEDQTVDTSASDGHFSIQVGSATGAVKRGANDQGHSMAAVFQNKGAISAFNLGACGGTYTPAANDERYMRVTVNSNVMSPDFALQAVPFAVTAETLQGSVPANFINVTAAANLTQANVESIFNSTGYTNLSALIAGTSSLYMKATPTANVGFGGYVLNNVGTPAVATDAANKGYVDSSIGGQNASITGVSAGSGNGLTLVWNQSANRWEAGTPTVSDVTKLPLAGGTMSGPIAMTGQNITDVGHVTMSTQRTFHVSNYNNAQDTGLSLAAPDEGKIWYNSDSNQLRLWNGSAKVDIGGNAITSLTGDIVATGPGAAAATLSNNSITTAKIGTNPGVNRLVMTDASTGAGLAFATCALNEILEWQGSGWTCIPKPASPWGTVASNTYYAAGNVGIGTSTPSRALDVIGPVRFSPTVLPGSPVAGDIVFDSGDSNKMKYHDGTAWRALGTGSGDFLANGSVNMTGPLRAPAGSVSTPSISFSGDTDTGLFSSSANEMAIAAGGSIHYKFNNIFMSSGNATGYLIPNGTGTAAGPTYSWVNSSAAGMFSPANNIVAFSTAGIERARIDSGGNMGIGVAAPTSILDVNGAIISRPWGISVGETGAIKMRELGANGTNYAALRAADNMGADVTWTLPANDGSAGMVLSTNGTGALTWTPPSLGDFRADGSVNMTGDLNFATNRKIRMAGAPVFGIVGSSNQSVGIGTTTFLTNSTADGNVAIGFEAMKNATTSSNNVAVGKDAMRFAAASSNNNVAIGAQAGVNLSSGGANTFLGMNAGSSMVSNIQNVLVGVNAGQSIGTGDYNTIIGANAGTVLTSGSNNILIGRNANAPMATSSFALNIGDVIKGDTNAKRVAIGGGDPLATMQVFSEESGPAVLVSHYHNGAPNQLNFQRARGTRTVPNDVQVGDILGGMVATGFAAGTFGTPSAAVQFAAGENFTSASNKGTRIHFSTTQNGSGTMSARMVIDEMGNVGIGTMSPSTSAKLQVNGSIVGGFPDIPSGSIVDFTDGNVGRLQSVGGTTITLQNMISGGQYTVVVADVTSRTYTFSGCTNSYFSPANGATTNRSVFNVTYAGTDCYIDWKTGYN